MKNLTLRNVLVSISLILISCNFVFAATPASVMRKIQARYNWLMESDPDETTKYHDWGSIEGKPIPSFPADDFFDDCDSEETLLDRIIDGYSELKDKFYKETPEGKDYVASISYNCTAETTIDDIDGWLDDMKYYKVSTSSDSNEQHGEGNDSTETDRDGSNCIYVTEQASFDDAKNEAIGDLNDWNCNYKIGIYLRVVSNENQCDNDCEGTYDCRSYSVSLTEDRGVITCDLTDYSNVTSAKCYIMLSQDQMYNCGSGYVYKPCPDGATDVYPVAVDDKFHEFTTGGTPTVGSDWTSQPLFSSHPTITQGNYTKGWCLEGHTVFLEPTFTEDNDPVGSGPTVTEKVYKDQDDHIAYSAALDCGYDSGETVNGKIIAPDGNDLSYQIKVEDYDTSIATVSFGNPDTCWEYYNPGNFSISAKVGETSVNYNIRTWQKTISGSGKITVAKSEESYSFQIKTNGYECCNRKEESNKGQDHPSMFKHENGDIELNFGNLGQSYIWGNGFNMMGMVYSQTCAFLDADISTFAANSVELKLSGSKRFVSSVPSAWSDSDTTAVATFDKTVDTAGNAIIEADYDAYGRLNKLEKAVDPSNLYRQFSYEDSNDPNKVTSFTDYAGDWSREYTLVYDEDTGRVSGTIGGDGSGCSSCCSSGGNILYTYNDAGYILTESNLNGNIIHEYEYDSQNRLIAKWLGAKTDMIPVQEIIYDTNGAGDYNGAEIKDIYNYVDGTNYRLTRNILNSNNLLITKIQFDELNVDDANISSDPNTIIANGGLITTYEYDLYGDRIDAIDTISPEFNTGNINTFRRNYLNNSSTNYSKDILVEVDANETETEAELIRSQYNSDEILVREYNWYALQGGTYSDHSYTNGMLTQQRQNHTDQLNTESTRLRYNYTYHPDGRMNTEMISNNGVDDTELITSYLYDDVNHPTGTIVKDHDGNTIYQTWSKSNGLGDVIYTIDRTGVARGTEYDAGGKVISEFVFAEPNDTTLFDDASLDDISGVYEDVNVISQTQFHYDSNGRLEYTYKAIADDIFVYDTPATWSITAYTYDAYGRKTSQTEDVIGLALTTSYEYNNQGQIVKTTYPDNHWVKNIYNGRGLVTKTIEGYGAESTDPNDFVITENVYDGDGQVIKTKKAETVITSYEYDSLGNVYKQYQGDYETEYCNYTQYERNYAGDILSQKFVDVNSTGDKIVIHQTDYRYNNRAEKIEERILFDPNGEPNDLTDKVSLFSYDFRGNLTETVIKADNCDQIYTDQSKEEVNYEQGDHIRQSWYDIEGNSAYTNKFDCIEVSGSVPLPFYDINDMFSYAKDTRDIFITKTGYDLGLTDNTEILTDYNEAHPDFYDYQYYQNFQAGLEWKTVSAYEYDTAARMIKSYDAAQNYTTIEYDSLNNPIANTLWQGQSVFRINDNPDPNFTPYPVTRALTAYNALGMKTKEATLADPNINIYIDSVRETVDKITEYIYDANGKLYRQKECLGLHANGSDLFALIEYTYDGLGRTSQILKGELQEVDVFGEIWETKFPFKYTGISYNDMSQNNIRTITDVNLVDQTTTDVNTYYSYDAQGRITEIENQTGALAQYFYDSMGRRTKQINAAGMLTEHVYNGLGDLALTIEDANTAGLQRTTYFAYDRKGRKTQISDGSNSTYYTYNYLDEITEIDYPSSDDITYSYDLLGNITTRTIDGVTTNYKLDDLGRISYKQFSNDPNWHDPNTALPFDEILYDAAGNKTILAYIDDNNELELAMYSYDGLGNLTGSAESFSDISYGINYTYDQRGLLIAVEYPNEKMIEYNRDALGRIDTVSYNGDIVIEYYYLGHKIIKKQFSTNVDIDYTATIDSLGRITSEDYGNITRSYDYLTHTTRLTDRNDVEYGYDTLGRVTSEDATSYTCDILGNPTNAGEDDLIYTLDNESRIIDVNDGSGVIAQYSYDRLGRRTSKTVDSNTICFAYDQFGNVIAEYQKDGNDVTWQKDYVYGAKGELVYMQLPMTAEASEAGDDFISFCEAWLCYPDCDTNELDWDYNNDDDITFVDFTVHVNDFDLAFANNGRYILTDFTNSVIGIADSNSLTQITYNAWGTPSCSGDLDGLNILWNGYYYDDETDNYYLRNRYYSPLERKFITPDPRGINPDENWNNPFNPIIQTIDGTALDVYAQGDPINKRDDWGLACTSGDTKLLRQGWKFYSFKNYERNWRGRWIGRNKTVKIDWQYAAIQPVNINIGYGDQTGTLLPLYYSTWFWPSEGTFKNIKNIDKKNIRCRIWVKCWGKCCEKPVERTWRPMLRYNKRGWMGGYKPVSKRGFVFGYIKSIGSPAITLPGLSVTCKPDGSWENWRKFLCPKGAHRRECGCKN